MGVNKSKFRLLLHSCCGPCSTAVIERLEKDYNVTVFFYNPNITDQKEYERRRASQKQYLERINECRLNEDRVKYIEGEYRPDYFYDAVRGLEEEPEGGARCLKCFKLRLRKTAEFAKTAGFERFGTTLSVSPHKNYNMILQIGNELSLKKEIAFLEEDFKKRNGYLRSIELSKRYGLYRQDYCGCKFSRNETR